MDSPGTSRRTLTDSTKENNISMLLDKLKELRMSANDDAEARVYGKVESKYHSCFNRMCFKCNKRFISFSYL